MIGSLLGRFQISGKLGEGGMGEVYQASDTRLGRDVAIKVLPESFVGDADRLSRFEREARSLAALDHPNIAGIHEIGEDEGTVFLVLELVPGETLAELLASARPSVREALEIARDIGRALEAAARYHLGEYEASKSLLEDLSVPWVGSGVGTLLATNELRLGEDDHAHDRLAKFLERNEPFGAGIVHAALGDYDEAFAAFERVEAWGQWPITTVRYLFPGVLGPMREDPRWNELMERINKR